MKALRGLPPGLLWMVAAAALFLLGAANAGWHGLHQMTQLGVGGAIVALVVVAVFCDWQRPRSAGPQLRRTPRHASKEAGPSRARLLPQ